MINQRNFVRFSVVFLSFIIFLLLPLTAAVKGKEKYEEKFEKTISLDRSGKVELSNISGNAEVKVWTKKEVRVEAVKIARASTQKEAKENAARVNIEVKKEGNTVSIITRYPKSPFRNLNVSVNYRLSIPDKASLRVKSVSGDVTCTEIGGFLNLNTVSGDITVEKAVDGVDLNAVSGDIKVDQVAGDTEVKTVSGEIEIGQLEGSVEATSVSGDIRLGDVSQAYRVKVSTLSGDVEYSGDLNPKGIYSLKTHSGNLAMWLPSGSRFDLEASTFSGNIQSDFEITMSGEISPKKIKGQVNGGGAELALKTFSGDIKLKKKS
ncbi:MAG: hypothetical protein B5M54_06735 [Candidatus Aminicenantes bacterium 4484_214]|nr:MAG: hypothetical protein B5M54_06735 [Candidatus Aminicenantes bacterium 4484_214]